MPPQVVALQERLLSAEAEKIAIERSVREEVAAEMKEHLEATEAELRERMELERCVCQPCTVGLLVCGHGGGLARSSLVWAHGVSTFARGVLPLLGRE